MDVGHRWRCCNLHRWMLCKTSDPWPVNHSVQRVVGAIGEHWNDSICSRMSDFLKNWVANILSNIISISNISSEHYCDFHGNEVYIHVFFNLSIETHVFRWARHPLLPPIRQFGMPSNAQRITRLTTPSPWSLLLEKLKLYNRRTEAHPVVLVSVGVSQDHWRRLLWIVLHILEPSARFPTLLLCQNAWSLSSYCSFRSMARFYDQGLLKLLGRHFSEAMLLNATDINEDIPEM